MGGIELEDGNTVGPSLQLGHTYTHVIPLNHETY